MTKPRRYGGKSHPATPTQEQTRPITTETSNLYKKKNCFWLQRRALKKQKLQVDDQTAEIWWKSHLATPTQEQTKPISTETSNLYGKYAVSDRCCANGHCRNKSCKLMTKPRRYGGKAHLATPTQEQTRPISTETSNLYGKYAVSDRCCVNGHFWNKSCKLMTKPRRYGGKSHLATPTQEQTRPISTETSNLYKQYAVCDVSCKNEHWKKSVASWWPNRAGMVENLIPQRQLRSKRDQYRRKLAI